MTTQRAALTARDVATRPPSAGVARRALRPLRLAQGFLSRHLSIRWKLTIWYTLIYVVTLAAVALALPVVFEVKNNQAINASLQRTAAGVLASHPIKDIPAGPLGRNFPNLPSACRDSALVLQQYCSQIQSYLTKSAFNPPVPGQYEQVQLGGYGPTHGKYPLITPHLGARAKLSVGLPADPVIRASLAPVFTTVSEGGSRYSAYVVKINPPDRVVRNGGGAWLEVLQKQTTYAEVQSVLFKIVLVAIPFMTLFALVVGWFVARAALRPVRRISRTVQSIGGSRDLSRRLDFVGPTDEVGRLAATFDDMMDRLQQSFETQKRFIADASHELRTPLTAIKGNAELIGIAPPDERDLCIAAIRREAERMSRLVNDLLLLAEADIAEQPIHPSRVRLDALVEDVFRAGQLIGGDKVEVLLEGVEPLETEADPDRIKQLLLNLVDNAVKFTPLGGVVSIRLERNDSWAEITVSDTGVGIAPDEQAAIFRRFYRVDTSRSTRGSGLGLAISAWIAEAHGGSVVVSSEPGKGSTFTLRLPIVATGQPETTQVPTPTTTRA